MFPMCIYILLLLRSYLINSSKNEKYALLCVPERRNVRVHCAIVLTSARHFIALSGLVVAPPNGLAGLVSLIASARPCQAAVLSTIIETIHRHGIAVLAPIIRMFLFSSAV